MCDLLDSQPAGEKKLSRMKKLRRTLSESFGRIENMTIKWAVAFYGVAVSLISINLWNPDRNRNFLGLGTSDPVQ
uniref:Uncharacterized protein n=1 Tax=Sphaerodactylus townsendi TaxID=933632 RepID=A0ACB8FVG4_9SAUR